MTPRRLAPLLLFLHAAACLAAPAATATPSASLPFILAAPDNPFESRPSDEGRRSAGAILTTINLVERTDLDPPRVAVILGGSLPSVCNELRVDVEPPDPAHRIRLTVFSLVNPAVECDNVFQQFDAEVLLGVYSSGRYTVWVNEGLIGDFIAP